MSKRQRIYKLNFMPSSKTTESVEDYYTLHRRNTVQLMAVHLNSPETPSVEGSVVRCDHFGITAKSPVQNSTVSPNRSIELPPQNT